MLQLVAWRTMVRASRHYVYLSVAGIAAVSMLVGAASGSFGTSLCLALPLAVLRSELVTVGWSVLGFLPALLGPTGQPTQGPVLLAAVAFALCLVVAIAQEARS